MHGGKALTERGNSEKQLCLQEQVRAILLAEVTYSGHREYYMPVKRDDNSKALRPPQDKSFYSGLLMLLLAETQV